jgi:SAM-dependent methyltransferase
MNNTAVQNHDYMLGNSAPELQRLIHQARFYGDLTEQLFRLAGIGRGMRVLDIGCGPGDVAFLAAQMVGTDGFVIGVDRSPEAIATARSRADAARLTNLRFIAQDVSELTLDEPVDAILGRLILMYLNVPAGMIRRLLDDLNPGGIVAFPEIDISAAKTEPYCDLFETTAERIRQTFARSGVDYKFGLRLRHILQDAGLPPPQMIQGTRVEAGWDSPGYAVAERMVHTLLPLMKKTGVATPEEVGLETLAARLREEVVARNAVVVFPPLIGAWARKA